MNLDEGVVRGAGAADQTRYFDVGVASYTLTLETRKQPIWAATLKALDWTPVGSGGAPSGYAYGFPQMPAWTGTNTARGYVAGVARCWSKVVISVTQDLMMVDCHTSNQGASQWSAQNRRVTVECTRVVSDTSAITAAPGDTAGVVQIDLNTTPGRSGSILIPAANILEQPTIVDVNGVLSERVLYGCPVYSGDGSNGTASNTAFRFAAM